MNQTTPTHWVGVVRLGDSTARDFVWRIARPSQQDALAEGVGPVRAALLAQGEALGSQSKGTSALKGPFMCREPAFQAGQPSATSSQAFGLG